MTLKWSSQLLAELTIKSRGLIESMEKMTRLQNGAERSKSYSVNLSGKLSITLDGNIQEYQ